MNTPIVASKAKNCPAIQPDSDYQDTMLRKIPNQQKENNHMQIVNGKYRSYTK